jgi:hypothetical protein
MLFFKNHTDKFSIHKEPFEIPNSSFAILFFTFLTTLCYSSLHITNILFSFFGDILN